MIKFFFLADTALAFKGKLWLIRGASKSRISSCKKWYTSLYYLDNRKRRRDALKYKSESFSAGESDDAKGDISADGGATVDRVGSQAIEDQESNELGTGPSNISKPDRDWAPAPSASTLPVLVVETKSSATGKSTERKIRTEEEEALDRVENESKRGMKRKREEQGPEERAKQKKRKRKEREKAEEEEEDIERANHKRLEKEKEKRVQKAKGGDCKVVRKAGRHGKGAKVEEGTIVPRSKVKKPKVTKLGKE